MEMLISELLVASLVPTVRMIYQAFSGWLHQQPVGNSVNGQPPWAPWLCTEYFIVSVPRYNFAFTHSPVFRISLAMVWSVKCECEMISVRTHYNNIAPRLLSTEARSYFVVDHKKSCVRSSPSRDLKRVDTRPGSRHLACPQFKVFLPPTFFLLKSSDNLLS